MTRPLSLLVACGLVAAVVFGLPSTGGAQIGTRMVPSPAYFTALAALNDGEYKAALRAFQGTRGISSTQGRWIDSICYYTMTGECFYRLGDYAQALENYEAALRIYLQYSNWMIQVQFPPTIQAAPQPRPAPWGQSTRRAMPGRFPETMSIAVGTANVENTLRTGGVITPPALYPVQVQEIIRCTCLSMMRRREILGPLVTYDPLTDELINTAARRQGPPNHWSQAWLDALQGFAYSAGDKAGQALGHLKQSLVVQGQFDHPATALALLELGRMMMESGDPKTAAGYFQEATYAAYAFGDMTVLEEAFRGLHQAAIVSGDTASIDGLLTAALGWSRTRGRELHASLGLMLAENLALRRQTQQASGFLSDVKGAIGRRDMAACGVGSRLFYLTAMVDYQRGAQAAGDAALASALRWQSNGALWLFQISLADTLCTTNPGGRYSSRVAADLYEKLLRDPAPADWLLRPLESLAVMSTPHPLPFEHWFEAMRDRQNHDGALEVADRARRHRFLSTLSLGGRLTALRWVLEAPEEVLDNQGRLQRKELLQKYPKYAQAAQAASAIQAGLAQAGIASDPEALREQANQLGELAKLSAAQELILREMAIRREPAEIVFPPIRKTKQVQAELAPGQLLLAFFSTRGATYGWLYSNNNYAHWKITNPALLEKRIAALLREIGNYDGTQEIAEKQFENSNWQPPARDVLQSLLEDSKVTFNAPFQEIVIVPDGVLWYLPFEALPAGDPGEFTPLISHSKVRYAPTMGLALPQRQGRKTTPHVGLALGRLHPGDDPKVAEAAAEEIGRAAKHAAPLRGPLAVQSPLWGTAMDSLVVLDDIDSGRATYDWSPLPLDRNKGAGTLDIWLSLPWKRVDQFILPGFHSSAETSLARNVPRPPGSELFLNATGLMATGARTVLLSRWRTGGQTAVDLTREFVQELPYVAADEAWQRAVQLVRQSPLDPNREPRVKRAGEPLSLTASHPFFWAGYMLVDSGALPVKVEEPKAPPVLKFEDKKPMAGAMPPAADPTHAPPQGEMPPDAAPPEAPMPPNEPTLPGAGDHPAPPP